MSVFNPPRVPAPIVAATILLVLVWAGLTLRSLGDLARHYIDGDPVTITDVGFAVIGSGIGFLLYCGAAFGLWQGNRVAQIAVLVLAGLTVVVGFLSQTLSGLGQALIAGVLIILVAVPESSRAWFRPHRQPRHHQ